jgi:cytosine/adenosine deaminase-related metal-dependent hydrolase
MKMSTTVIYDNQYLNMVYHTDKKIVHHHYYKKLNSEYLRAGLNRGNELLQEHGATKWLSDNREVNAHSPEDTEWINTDWLPRAVAAGWKYWALVVPYDTIARMNMKKFVEAFYEMGVRVMVFEHVGDAMDWLETVDR